MASLRADLHAAVSRLPLAECPPQWGGGSVGVGLRLPSVTAGDAAGVVSGMGNVYSSSTQHGPHPIQRDAALLGGGLHNMHTSNTHTSNTVPLIPHHRGNPVQFSPTRVCGDPTLHHPHVSGIGGTGFLPPPMAPTTSLPHPPVFHLSTVSTDFPPSPARDNQQFTPGSMDGGGQFVPGQMGRVQGWSAAVSALEDGQRTAAAGLGALDREISDLQQSLRRLSAEM